MQEPIVRMAARLNNMPMDFPTLYAKVFEETGESRIGGAYVVQIPVLTHRNNKMYHAAFRMNMKASSDSLGEFLFYSLGKRDVYVIRDATLDDRIPFLSLATADIQPVKDEKGFNTPPYIEFVDEVTVLQLATQDVSHLLATWYASMLINDYSNKY